MPPLKTKRPLSRKGKERISESSSPKYHFPEASCSFSGAVYSPVFNVGEVPLHSHCGGMRDCFASHPAVFTYRNEIISTWLKLGISHICAYVLGSKVLMRGAQL